MKMQLNEIQLPPKKKNRKERKKKNENDNKQQNEKQTTSHCFPGQSFQDAEALVSNSYLSQNRLERPND